MLYPAELQALLRPLEPRGKATEGSESAQRAERPFSSNIMKCRWLVGPSPDRRSHTPSGRSIHACGSASWVSNTERSTLRASGSSTGDAVTVGLGEASQACSFGQVLSDETVGVFVGSPFPGVVRGGEEEASGGGGLEELVALELGTVVGSDGVDGDWS